jgi:hypothetical protein
LAFSSRIWFSRFSLWLSAGPQRLGDDRPEFQGKVGAVKALIATIVAKKANLFIIFSVHAPELNFMKFEIFIRDSSQRVWILRRRKFSFVRPPWRGFPDLLPNHPWEGITALG